MRRARALAAVAVFSLASACGGGGGERAAPRPRVVREDPPDVMLAGLSAEEVARHERGDALFDRVFREAQGLGPVFVRAACAACHERDARGPGAVQRMALAGDDGEALAGRAAVDLAGALMPFGSVVRPQLAAGATRGVLPPAAPPPAFRLSARVGPAVYGRGWIEAVDEAEVVREAARQAAAGRVSGRVPRLPDGALGRFGVKARLPTLEAFTADAFRGDMGLTSPRLPDEVPNPDGLRDDARPGTDLAADAVDDVAFYVRTLDIPARAAPDAQGAALFARVGCADCHTPRLRTRADHPLRALAGASAEVYSDLLLHDMGRELADGVAEGAASGREWRTPPLVGLRFFRTLLHDGRARSVDDAIRAHRGAGSEAAFAVDAFDALAPDARRALVAFVEGL